jgi:hypothetical protein
MPGNGAPQGEALPMPPTLPALTTFAETMATAAQRNPQQFHGYIVSVKPLEGTTTFTHGHGVNTRDSLIVHTNEDGAATGITQVERRVSGRGANPRVSETSLRVELRPGGLVSRERVFGNTRRDGTLTNQSAPEVVGISQLDEGMCKDVLGNLGTIASSAERQRSGLARALGSLFVRKPQAAERQPVVETREDREAAVKALTGIYGLAQLDIAPARKKGGPQINFKDGVATVKDGPTTFEIFMKDGLVVRVKHVKTRGLQSDGDVHVGPDETQVDEYLLTGTADDPEPAVVSSVHVAGTHPSSDRHGKRVPGERDFMMLTRYCNHILSQIGIGGGTGLRSAH